MSTLDSFSVPVLSCTAARELEERLFAGGERAEWPAMQQAGAAITRAVLDDFREIGGFPADGQVLVLAGKGHNGGDALIAARLILRQFPAASVDVLFVFGERTLRPLAMQAWRELQHAAPDRVTLVHPPLAGADAGAVATAPAYALCLDGLFGFQFRPPVDERTRALLERVNAFQIRLRAAVDLPSADLFRADFTYATGSVKSPVLSGENAGRVRYLDLGFFPAAQPADDQVVTTRVLALLREFRPGRSDKRRFGHVFILGGSLGYPGAVLMCALAAIRSGAGLVTAFVPESLVPAFAARLPEVIWVGWPETPSGGLALEGEHRWLERLERADAIVVGPGMGRDRETLALVHHVVQTSNLPLVIDADALQPDIVQAGTAPRVLTPHAGEFQRIAEGKDLREFAADPKLTVVLKGPITRIGHGGGVYHSLFGGPVLARGGSGDLLAGMIGTQLAQQPDDPLLAAARATVWHGHSADLLARAHGQVAVQTTQLLDFLGAALLSEAK